MTEAWKRRLFAVGALAIAGSALGYISFSDMGEDLVYYWSPSELMAREDRYNHTVRLGGQVEPDSIQWDKEAQTVRFVVSDGEASLNVFSQGNPPQMFRSNIGVVVEGQLEKDDVFRTDKIMVKHSNEYKAPEEGDDLAAMKTTLEE